jgi:hypothetical protein
MWEWGGGKEDSRGLTGALSDLVEVVLNSLLSAYPMLSLNGRMKAYVRGVNTWFPENVNEKNQLYVVRPFCIFSLSSWLRATFTLSGSSLITAGAPRQSLPLFYFSNTHLSSSSRPPGWEWGWPARPRPTPQQWEHCLRMSRNCGSHSYGRLAHPESLLLHLQVNPFGHPPGRLLWELQVLIRAA